jgi:pheophorbide a oxygenase
VTFDLEWAPDALALAKQNVTIVPPCYIEYSTPLQSARDLEGKSAAVRKIGLRACLWFYLVPLDESSCRLTNNAVIVAHGLPPWTVRLLNRRPKWIDHLFLQNVLDGDMAYLPQAACNEKLGLFSSSPRSSSSPSSSPPVLDARGELWATRYFMPANADASVVAWRRWLHGERGRSGWLDAVADASGGGGGAKSFSNASSSSAVGSARVGRERFPALSSSSFSSLSERSSNVVPLPRADLPRSERFDRWNQHTKNCPSCSRAMGRAQGVKKALEVSAAASGMFASSSALLLVLSASPSSSGGGEVALVDAQLLLHVLLSSSALAALSLLSRRAAATFESWFVFKDYEHWKS